jgi:AraC family transcriptional regulator
VPLSNNFGNAVRKITSATEVLDGLRPLLSNAESGSGELKVERYKTGSHLETTPAYFENQHLVAIQWAGLIQENGPTHRSSTAEAAAIFPAGLVLRGSSMFSAEFTNLSLTLSFLRRVAVEMDYHDRFELLPQWGARDDQIKSIAQAAECEVSSDLKAGNLFMDSLAIALAAHVLARYSSRQVQPRKYRGGLTIGQLRRTRDFIEANLGKDLGLAELAANVRMSPYYFCRLFKQSTSLSPHQFVIRERIERAQELLKEHRLTMVEIASNLGFSDQSHFARVFHKLVGTSPRRYTSQY